MQLKAQILRRFEKRNRFFRENKLFETNAKKFYREIGKPKTTVNDIPPKEGLKSFWNGIQGQERNYNEAAEWINNTNSANGHVPEQEWKNLTMNELKISLTMSQKWKSPGIDKVPNFWLNTLLSAHFCLTNLLNEVIMKPTSAPKWLCQGTTFLLPKTNNTTNPKNYHPITCLSTTYKILTSILSERLYEHIQRVTSH